MEGVSGVFSTMTFFAFSFLPLKWMETFLRMLSFGILPSGCGWSDFFSSVFSGLLVLNLRFSSFSLEMCSEDVSSRRLVLEPFFGS